MNEKKFLGLIIILIGVLILGNVLNIWNVDLFFKGWWTMFLIIPSILGLFKKLWIPSIIGLSVGVIFLLSANGIVSWLVVFPVALISFGISLLVKKELK